MFKNAWQAMESNPNNNIPIYQYSELKKKQQHWFVIGDVVITTGTRPKPEGHFWNEYYQTQQSLIY